jgi:hypothetical protein
LAEELEEDELLAESAAAAVHASVRANVREVNRVG